MRNRFEKEVYNQLTKKFGKDNVEYEPTKFGYTTRSIYTPDFRVSGANDHEFYIESKGYFRQKDMRNLRAVTECNPALDLRLLFYRNDKYNKTMRYSDWAEKYDFPYGIMTIPKEWK